MTGATAILYPVVRGLLFATLLLLIGSAVTRQIVAAEHLAVDPDWDLAVRRRLRRLTWHLAWILPALVLTRGALQVATFVDADTPVSGALVQGALTEGGWGHAWLLQVGVTVLLPVFLWPRPRVVREALAAVLAFIALWAQTGMGHPAGNSWPGPTGRLVDLTHLLGAGMWLGTLGVLAITVFPMLRGTTKRRELHLTVQHFSIWARVGAALVVASGLLAAWTYGGSISAILSSTWGHLLLFKLAFLFGVMMLGWWNWRVMTPALGRELDRAPRWLTRAVRAELLLGLAMLAITAWLVASPLPGEGR